MRSRGEGEIGAIVRRAARSTSALFRRSRSQSRSTRGVIDERARRTIAQLVDRRRSLFFLSLSPEIIWTENKSVKLFPGQRSKYWSTGNEFLENFIFRCSQTCGFGGKWFPEIIFIQNKRTLRLCLVRVKAFPENILFSGKENVFTCLAATKFVLRKINYRKCFTCPIFHTLPQL